MIKLGLIRNLQKKVLIAKTITEEKIKMRKEIENDITKVRDYIETIIATSDEAGIIKAIKHFKKIYKIEFEDKFIIEDLSKSDKELLLRDIGKNIIEAFEK